MKKYSNFPVLALLLGFFCGITPGLTVELRVATLNVGGDFGANFGLGEWGTTDHDAVADILGRVDADVVTLQEIFDNDLDGTPDDSSTSDATTFADDLANLATTLGYSHRYTGYQTSLDPFLRCVILSRYPLTVTDAADSIDPANEMSRVAPAVVVDVPGTDNDPTIIGLHLKAGTDADDPFRRAIEMRRVNDYLDAQGLGEDDNIIVLGDFNLDLDPGTITYNSLPSGLPGSYTLGTDVTFPVPYTESPEFYFSTPSLTRLTPTRLNGATNTFVFNSRIIDHILVSPAIAGRGVASEIYDSQLDVDNVAGLPKSGSPLNNNRSFEASDHYLVFADLELDGGTSLVAAVSQPTIAENAPPGTATLDLTISPAPGPSESVVVYLTSSDPGEATFAITSLTFTTGDTSLSVNILPQTDGIVDGTQSITFTASTTGAADAQATIEVLDVDFNAYVFSALGETIIEEFNTFAGTSAPLNWSTTATPWRGGDDGSGSLAGNYAYGTTEFSLGLLADGAATFTARYHNGTGSIITALQVQYDAEQWRILAGGAPASWSAELIVNGTTTGLGDLTFWADTTGNATEGEATTLSTIIPGLSIPADTSFFLRFTATPGAGTGTPSDEVFINEFHYDNTSGDTGEFVEVVIGPGFAGSLDDIELQFYNGSNGSEYAPAVKLSDFTIGDTSNGYRFFSLLQPGIQNGNPDGLALVDTSTDPDTVLEFSSYEGTFTASAGAAAGLTSTDIGVSQSSTNPVGTDSLGLTGSGAEAADLTWDEFEGQAHTPGALNPGQTLATPGAPPQGIAIDNVAVSILADYDGDGDPDLTDPDDDNDGFTDLEEAAAGTDPFNAADFPVAVTADPVITSTTYNPDTQTLAITFTGDPGVTTWEVKGTSNPALGFPDDLTPASYTEVPAGVYSTTLDVSAAGGSYYVRVVLP